VVYNFYRTYDPATGRYLSADLLGQTAGTNEFWYALTSPLRYIDPLGLKIVIVGSDAYKASVEQAIAYGKTVPDEVFPSGENPLKAIDESDRTFVIEEGSQDFATGLPYVGSSTIYFDPNRGLELTGKPCPNIQSPALGLLHEAGHGQVVATNGALVTGLAAFLGGREAMELSVIETVETPAANFLGEPTRTTHTGELVPVAGPVPPAGWTKK